jgi:hypothetical protein
MLTLTVNFLDGLRYVRSDTRGELLAQCVGHILRAAQRVRKEEVGRAFCQRARGWHR